MQARRDALRGVGKIGDRGEKDTREEDGREEGELGSRSRNLGNRRGVLGFHLQGVECWPRHARVDGVAGGCLRTAGFSSVIIAEQQQSDDPLVYGTLRVGFRVGLRVVATIRKRSWIVSREALALI